MERFESEHNHCSTFQNQKREFGDQDRISYLSNDVLVMILSRVPMKVAVKTSILSQRWRKIWTYLPRLEFDDSNIVLKIKRQPCHNVSDRSRISELLESEKVRYVNLVNHFVESYRLPAIDEFRLCIGLNESNKADIDKWIKFGFEMKVKRLELDFSKADISLYRENPIYTLFPQSLGLPRSISLTSLVLKEVDVSGKVLHKFISNSPFLEYLCVLNSPSLTNLRVVGPSLPLKYTFWEGELRKV